MTKGALKISWRLDTKRGYPHSKAELMISFYRIISISGPVLAYTVAVQSSGGHQTKIEQITIWVILQNRNQRKTHWPARKDVLKHKYQTAKSFKKTQVQPTQDAKIYRMRPNDRPLRLQKMGTRVSFLLIIVDSEM